MIKAREKIKAGRMKIRVRQATQVNEGVEGLRTPHSPNVSISNANLILKKNVKSTLQRDNRS